MHIDSVYCIYPSIIISRAASINYVVIADACYSIKIDCLNWYV